MWGVICSSMHHLEAMRSWNFVAVFELKNNATSAISDIRACHQRCEPLPRRTHCNDIPHKCMEVVRPAHGGPPTPLNKWAGGPVSSGPRNPACGPGNSRKFIDGPTNGVKKVGSFTPGYICFIWVTEGGKRKRPPKGILGNLMWYTQL